MRKLARLLLAPMLFGLFLCSSEAQADTIIITSGFARVTEPATISAGSFSFAGEGLIASGSGDRNSARGSNIHGAPTFRGEATANNTTHANIHYTNTVLRFESNIFFRPPADSNSPQTLLITVPFTMTGTLVGNFGSLQNPPLFSLTVTGWGLATATLQLFQVGSDFFYIHQDIRYDFLSNNAPVPEPATILLLGTGLAAGVITRLRSRRRTGRI
jgi:PEP-CTERM motif